MRRELIGLLLGISSTMVMAEGEAINPVLDESFHFRLGANFLNVDGDLSSSRSGVDTPDVDLDTLGMDDDYTSPYFRFRWRPSDRWRLSFNYFKFDNDGDVTETFDFDFGDLDVSGFARVETKLKTEFYVAQAGYSFLKNERSELGLGAGFHVVDLDTKIKASAGLGPIGGQLGSESTDVTAPLPNVTAFATYAFTPKLSLDASVSYFSLSYDKYSGDLAAAVVNLEYRFTRNFGAGVGYNYVNMNLDIDHGDGEDTYDFTFKGPLVFLSAGF